MRDIERTMNNGMSRSWWRERTALEKVGVVSLGAAGAIVVGVVLFPHVAAAAAGGALTATGLSLLKKGLGA